MLYLRVPLYHLFVNGRPVASDAYFVSKLEKPYRRILLVFPERDVERLGSEKDHSIHNSVVLRDVGPTKWVELMREGYLQAQSIKLSSSSKLFRRSRLISLVSPAPRIFTKKLEEEVQEVSNALSLYRLVFGADPLETLSNVSITRRSFIELLVSENGVETIDTDSYVCKAYRWLFHHDEGFRTAILRLAEERAR